MQSHNNSEISLILLAAGESSRLGTPKQLLMYKGKNLLQHTIDLTQAMDMDTVLVLGAYIGQILNQVNTYDMNVVQNIDWREGLASSVRCGLKHVLSLNPETEAVILILCDQPLLTAETLHQVLEKFHTSGNPIIHCDYGDASGPPALFHKSMFPYLLQLQGHDGAKKLVKQFPEKVALVDFPDGKWDIDTAEDYDLINQNF